MLFLVCLHPVTIYAVKTGITLCSDNLSSQQNMGSILSLINYLIIIT